MPSFDMLHVCNLPYIKMLTQRTSLQSKSTLTHIRWIFFHIKLRFEVARIRSVRDELTILNVSIFCILYVLVA